MGYFEGNHPLASLNQYLHLSSRNGDEIIYIFKFDNRGAQVVLKVNCRDPHAIVYELIFDDDYYWNTLKDKFGYIIQGDSIDEILKAVCVRLEYLKNGSKS